MGKGLSLWISFLSRRKGFPEVLIDIFYRMSGQMPTTKSISGKEEEDCQDSLRL